MLLRSMATFWAALLMIRALGDEFSSVKNEIDGILHNSES